MNLIETILSDRILWLQDTEGRALSEVSSLSHSRYLGPEGSCPYAGRRQNGAMNLGALAQVRKYWPDIMDWLSPNMKAKSTLRQALLASLEAVCAPVIFDYRHHDQPLPGYLSARYKACLGFCQVFFFLLWNQEEMSVDLADLGSPSEFFDWLDNEGLLLGQDQVCAGSRTMIKALFEGFCHHQPPLENGEQLEQILTGIALQSVFALGSYQSTLGGRKKPCPEDLDLLNKNPNPWIFALSDHPSRDPLEVSKLFWPQKPPESVIVLLDDPSNQELYRRLLASGPITS